MEVVKKFIDEESEPDMTAKNFEVLYSDSARLHMRITAPMIKSFSSAEEKRDEFPEGIHVWFYEKTGEMKAEITANWARHDAETKIWEARNNVVLNSAQGQRLETEQMFWDSQQRIVYSNKYTKITQSNGAMASGESFWATQDFSEYKLYNRTGIGRTVIILKDDDDEI